MRARSAIALALVVAVGAMAYLFWPSDESRIRRLIRNEARAAEAADVEAFMKGIAFNYSDERGLSYLLIKRIAEREFQAMPDIDVEYEHLSISVSRESARALMDVRVLAGEDERRGYYLGDFKDPLKVALTLKKNAAAGWEITRADFSHADEPLR